MLRNVGSVILGNHLDAEVLRMFAAGFGRQGRADVGFPGKLKQAFGLGFHFMRGQSPRLMSSRVRGQKSEVRRQNQNVAAAVIASPLPPESLLKDGKW